MHEAPFALVSHKTGTRIRLKIPSKKKDHVFFETLSENILTIGGCRSVETNPLTGSVLISHMSEPDRIIQTIVSDGLVRFENSASGPPHLQERVSEVFNGINLALRDASGNEFDLGGSVFLILLAFGGYQIIKGNVTAIPWYAAGWYALNIFLKSNGTKHPAQ